MTSNVQAADAAPAIPGLTLRTYRSDDAEPLAGFLNRVFENDDVPWRTDPGEMASWQSNPNDHFDPARDTFLVEVDGTLVAHADAEWVDTTDGLREFRIGAAVDPAWRGRGIGSWLQRHLEAHARGLSERYPSERQPMLGSWASNSETARTALLQRFGFEPVRYFFDMVRPTLDEIDEPVLPNGIEFRPLTDSQWKQLWDADIEAFRDHWGGFDDSV